MPTKKISRKSEPDATVYITAPQVCQRYGGVSHRRHIWRMLGLTDNQLATVMDVACTLPVEKRDVYLQRIAAMLTMRGRGHFNDDDVTDVARLALTGLAQQPAA